MRTKVLLFFVGLTLWGCGGEQLAPPPHGPEDTMSPIRDASARSIVDATVLRDELFFGNPNDLLKAPIPGHRAVQVATLQAAALGQMEELMRRSLDGRPGACDANNAPLTGDMVLDSLGDGLEGLDEYLANRNDELAWMPPCDDSRGACGDGAGGRSGGGVDSATGLTPVTVHPGGTCHAGASLKVLVKKLRALSDAGVAYVATARSDQSKVVADFSEISALLLDRSITAYEVYGDQ